MRPQQQKPYHQRKQFNKKFDKNKPKGPPPFDVLLRQFKKKVDRAGTIQELRKREYYEKPAQKKQRKKKEAVRREQKNQEMNNTLHSRQRWY